MFKMLFFLFLVSCSTAQKEEGTTLTFPPLDESSPPSKKICVVGDVGTGGMGQHEVAKALEEENCQRILIPGDVVYPLGIKSTEDKKLVTNFLWPYRNLIPQTEFVLAMGNHDWYFPGHPKYWRRLAPAAPWLTYPHYYYAKQYEDICLFVFDSQWYKQNQYPWFEKEKGNFQNCKFSVAMAHHPYLSAGPHGNITGIRKKFLEKLVLGKFDLYLAGHDHIMADMGKVKGTRLLISGAGAKVTKLVEWPDGGWGMASLGYLVLEVENGQAKFEFKEVIKGKSRTAYSGTIQGKGLRN